MSRQFHIPRFYKSFIITAVKQTRQRQDPRKRDLSPSLLDFGPIRFKMARHFGFCYGVENAVEIAYHAIEENPDRRLFMLSEMIHNPHVNEDLQRRGMRFLRSVTGEQLIPFETLTPEDIVLIPAFGATLEIQADLRRRGIDIKTYDTTCPFIERVWRRSDRLGKNNYTIIVHGKRYHEETRATFSHARQSAPVVVVRDLAEAQDLCRVIRGEASASFFFARFHDRYSEGFDPERDLQRIGVVNQTTMLATETRAIADLLRQSIMARYGSTNGQADVRDYFADTSDTLCYATNENQQATQALLGDGIDIVLVVGGYNSSNTRHLVEICNAAAPTYFVKDAGELLSPLRLRHFDYATKTLVETEAWLPEHRPLTIALTAGASCPDILLDQVIHRVTGWVPGTRPLEDVLADFACVVVD